MQYMVDIECLGRGSDAVILQIGGCAFSLDINTVFRDAFNTDVDINIEEQIKAGRAIDNDTICWWLDSDMPDARRSVLAREDPLHIKHALSKLNNNIKSAKAEGGGDRFGIWANSPTYDLSILRHAMNQFDIVPNWKYGEEMDVRTMRRMNELLDLGVDYGKYRNEDVIAHDGAEDAMTQAQFIIDVVSTVKSRG